ncbi:cysteine desulfurase CsdA [Candidatus Peregrinibacteria bacterium]|nr:MAG: cysteine desulfurase CsdA [Candidatus Peregrinibacteria bacterium]
MKNIKKDFPFFQHHENIVYLDSAASAQKPQVMIDCIKHTYETSYANVHRGSFPVSDNITEKYEQARKTVAKFFHANPREVIFTKGTTDSINMSIRTLEDNGFIKDGDHILLTEFEHHSNLVPWLQLQKRKNIKIHLAPINDQQELDIKEYENLLKKHPIKITAFTHVSNTTGTLLPIKKMSELAKKHNAISIIDAAQSAAHIDIDVKDIQCDILAASAHKMYGPTSVGILYITEELLKKLSSPVGGGSMVNQVFRDSFEEQEYPQNFEAGTPPIVEAIGFAAACDYINSIGKTKIYEHEKELTEYAYILLETLPNIKIFSHKKSVGIINFFFPDHMSIQIAEELGERNICIRAGRFCTHPLLETLGISSSIRISLGMYNTKEDIDTAYQALSEIIA